MTQITRQIRGRAFGLDKDGDLVVNNTFGNVQVTDISADSLGAKNGATVTVQEYGNGVFNKTVLTFTNLPLTVRDTQVGGGVKVYDFPAGRIQRMGGSGSIAMTTTSVLASTLNAGVTCNWGMGSTTQASATLATTEQDFLQVTNITSSATINVAGAASNAPGAAVLAALDGTATAIDLFLNVAVATATDIDADATVLINGTATILWANAGDY